MSVCTLLLIVTVGISTTMEHAVQDNDSTMNLVMASNDNDRLLNSMVVHKRSKESKKHKIGARNNRQKITNGNSIA